MGCANEKTDVDVEVASDIIFTYPIDRRSFSTQVFTILLETLSEMSYYSFMRDAVATIKHQANTYNEPSKYNTLALCSKVESVMTCDRVYNSKGKE